MMLGNESVLELQHDCGGRRFIIKRFYADGQLPKWIYLVFEEGREVDGLRAELNFGEEDDDVMGQTKEQVTLDMLKGQIDERRAS